MTGRPPLPVGAHGNVKTAPLESGLWVARCRIRDADGRTRQVKRTGKSPSAARNALQAALTDRSATAGTALTGASRLREAGDVWLERLAELVAAGDRAPRTAETYASAWRLHVEPALGELRLREITPARCEAWQVALRRRVGASMTRTARAVLSAVLAHATRMGAITTNPVRELSPIPGAGGRTRKPRAMTADERAAWLDWLDTHVAHDPAKPRRPELHRYAADVIASRALGDVVRFMLATGCRVGEAMAISWDEVDLDARTVTIAWHVVRVKGGGLVRQEGAKSEAGERLLRVPTWCVDMLRRRREADPRGLPVFPDSLGGWRDPNLVARWIRWSREEAGFEWVTSHVFRQTVITVLDDAGISARTIADQAGHARVAQTQGYMQRRVTSDAAADALEGLI